MPSESFIVIDFETANSRLASICQVGLVTFVAGEIADMWGSLVNPEDYFSPFNISIHGITKRKVERSPTFPRLYDFIATRLRDKVVVSHTSFDRAALAQVTTKYGLEPICCQWLDSAWVVRRAWAKWTHRGYALSNVCEELGITYQEHDAVEDARAAGLVLLSAFSVSGLALRDWLIRAERPNKPIALNGNPDGPLVGEELVFTGALRLPRREAASLAARVGCNVAPGVRKSTTILVVGDQDLRMLHGHEKSMKHRKAESLIARGQHIRILTESDFVRLVELTT